MKLLRPILALILGLAAWALVPVKPAVAACSPITLPFNLVNGTIADAGQVMANFNAIVNGVNTGCAGAGINNDITALTATQAILVNCGAGYGCTTFTKNFGTIPDAVDWGVSIFRFGTTLTAAGTGVLGSANEWGMNIQVSIPNTGAAAPYEKAAILTQCYTSDPATALNYHDCVGGERMGVISGISNGRVFGGNDVATVIAGSDGLAVGLEIDVFNDGSDQPTDNTITTKHGLQIVAQGAASTTIGLEFIGQGPGQGFHQAILMNPNFLTPIGTDPNSAFITLFGLWSLRADGTIFQSTAASPVVDTFGSSAGGQLGIQFTNFPPVGSTSDTYNLDTFFNTSVGGVHWLAGRLQFQSTNSVAGSQASSFSLFTTSANTPHTTLFVSPTGHVAFPGTGAAPTIAGNCSTGGGAAFGSDTTGIVLATSSASTACVVNFRTAYASQPFCTVSGNTSQPLTVAITTASLTVTYASTASYQFQWNCFGQ